MTAAIVHCSYPSQQPKNHTLHPTVHTIVAFTQDSKEVVVNPPAYASLHTCCRTAGCMRNCQMASLSPPAGGGGRTAVGPVTAAEWARLSPCDNQIVKQLRG
jgi:hypothetical protein